MTEEKPKPPAEPPPPAPAAPALPKPIEPDNDIEGEEEKAKDMVKKANEAAGRLEAANAQTEKLVARQERLKVQETLGGTADAGTPQKTKEEKAKEDMKGLLGEGGLDPFAGEGENAIK